MKQLMMNELKEQKERGVYKIQYFSEEVEVEISDEHVEALVDCAIRLMEEVESMGKQGLLSKQIITDRAEELEKKYAGKEIRFYKVITGFVHGGIYDSEVFDEISETVGQIIGYDLNSAYWHLIGRASVLSGMVSAIEGYFINEDKKGIYESCVWMYIRSCMYMKSKMKEE